MKHSILYLFIISLLAGCGGCDSTTSNTSSKSTINTNSDTVSPQKQIAAIDDCVYCNDQDKHDATVLSAIKMILTFQTKFQDTKYYGGTILWNVDEQASFFDEAYDAFKFQYCLDANNNLFVAFENDKCDESGRVASPGQVGKDDCLVADKKNLFNTRLGAKADENTLNMQILIQL